MLKRAIALSLVMLLTGCAATNVNLPKREIRSTALVHIKVHKGEKQGFGTCSGVYVSEHEILTAAHCFEMGEDMTIKQIWIGQDNGTSALATLVDISPERDLALLKTDLKGIPVILGDPTRIGQEISVVGMPLGLRWVFTKGIISQVRFKLGEGNPTKHFILDAVVLPGNSGGPVFDENGYLVGILVRSTSMLGFFGGSGLGIAVDISEIRGFLG